jgi:hypothetical protein
MSYGILKQNGQNAYNIKEFVVDTWDEEQEETLNQLGISSAPGSTCFVIDTSEYYMLNTKKKWVKVNLNGDKTVQDIVDGKVEVIYDGGEVKDENK